MSRPALVRIAREAAKRAHWYMTDPVEQYRCGWETDATHRRIIGCNPERVRAFIAEGRRRLAIASEAYEQCPPTIADSSKEEIEFRLDAALRFIDHVSEHLEECIGADAGAMQ